MLNLNLGIAGASEQLESYIIMIDLRKRGGFSLGDRFKGLDLDHFKLVVEGQATLHAVSWAYKQHKGRNLSEIYPHLTGEGYADTFGMFTDQFLPAFEKEIEAFKNKPRIQDGLRQLLTIAAPVSKLYFNVPLKDGEKHLTKDTVLRNPLETVENEG